MHLRRRTIGMLALVGIGLTACSSPERDPAAEAGSDEGLQAATAALSPDMIRQLQAQYPVLGREPAPQPRPGADAEPGQIPARYRDVVSEKVLQTATGGATFYADTFEGKRTASGIPFRQNQMVAAHRSFPFGTLLRVTNLDTDRSVNVRVVDRGPFGSGEHRRKTMVDLSRRAAQQLGFVDSGRAQVRVEVLEWGDGLPRTG